jgi:hypothetical protein
MSQVAVLDVEALNSRLTGGHDLLISRDGHGRVECTVEFFDDRVPLFLFHTYLSNGLIALRKDGLAFGITTVGKKRLRQRALRRSGGGMRGPPGRYAKGQACARGGRPLRGG